MSSLTESRNCDCHGEPMYYRRDRGTWQCRAKCREASRRYNQRHDKSERARERERLWREQHPERMREHQRRFRAKRRALVAEKKAGGCLVCGSDGLLHLHHVDPSTKLFNIGHAVSGSDMGRDGALVSVTNAMFVEELEKCVPLCPKHHRAAHRAHVLLEEDA